MSTEDKTILLVEDNPAILKLTSRILSSLGYVAMQAENGSAALEIYQEHKAEIRAVITDMQMPDMTGSELSKQLLEDNPKLAIIFISGYTKDQLDENFSSDNIFFIQKPFTKATLAEILGMALEQQV
ncbi:MAG: two-component system cell cycle sensor histidine kinase/response regulator CckA [Kiritimatiellia bacterium]|jgi:two-component system, cell cycle sensor histidine kinase and response regulator CckA